MRNRRCSAMAGGRGCWRILPSSAIRKRFMRCWRCSCRRVCISTAIILIRRCGRRLSRKRKKLRRRAWRLLADVRPTAGRAAATCSPTGFISRWRAGWKATGRRAGFWRAMCVFRWKLPARIQTSPCGLPENSGGRFAIKMATVSRWKRSTV